MTDNSTGPQDIDEALLALQLMNLTVKKTAEGALRAGKADKYADLGEFNRVVLTALNNMGVIWTCLPTLKGDNFVLAYSLKHVPSGTAKEGDFPIPKGEPQKMGSAITYGRRYALGAVTGVAAEGDDDDGQGGHGRVRAGYAQRGDVTPRPVADRPATAQRDQRPARGEKSRPTQEPEPPTPVSAPTSPAPAGEPHRGRGGLITMPMAGLLSGEMKRLGFSDNERLPYVADLVNRPIASSKDLTYDEGRALIDALKKAAGSDDPKMRAAEIYIRITTGVPGDEPPARPAKKAARPVESRPVAEQTRDAVLGQPAGPNDRAPWDDDQTLLDEPPAEWPETAAPGGQR